MAFKLSYGDGLVNSHNNKDKETGLLGKKLSGFPCHTEGERGRGGGPLLHTSAAGGAASVC